MRTYPQSLSGKLIVPALLFAAFGATPAHACNYPDNAGFQDTAWVVARTPLYENVNDPRRECWDEPVRYEQREAPRGSNAGSAILGGLIGGVLGNSVGKGDGRKAATAAGVALGALAGNRYADGRRDLVVGDPVDRVEQRCRNVDNWTRKLIGYDVTYRYQGHQYTSFMPYDPGSSVRVNVSISLADR